MKKSKEDLLDRLGFNNWDEDLQYVVLFLFMIIGAICFVTTMPVRIIKKFE
ncbi:MULTISPECIES: hypothetical protein [unclassified Lactococcus]|uniref:hypothetical protein n=1 Tax=unclassified Lactococcus TaxID=2643510 RepID=UPI00257BCECB|nr:MULTISPECIES: hypothetical protein [unclassified Lactococcus]